MAVGKKRFDAWDWMGIATGVCLIPVGLFIVEFGRGRGWW